MMDHKICMTTRITFSKVKWQRRIREKICIVEKLHISDSPFLKISGTSLTSNHNKLKGEVDLIQLSTLKTAYLVCLETII